MCSFHRRCASAASASLVDRSLLHVTTASAASIRAAAWRLSSTNGIAHVPCPSNVGGLLVDGAPADTAIDVACAVPSHRRPCACSTRSCVGAWVEDTSAMASLGEALATRQTADAVCCQVARWLNYADSQGGITDGVAHPISRSSTAGLPPPDLQIFGARPAFGRAVSRHGLARPYRVGVDFDGRGVSHRDSVRWREIGCATMTVTDLAWTDVLSHCERRLRRFPTVHRDRQPFARTHSNIGPVLGTDPPTAVGLAPWPPRTSVLIMGASTRHADDTPKRRRYSP